MRYVARCTEGLRHCRHLRLLNEFSLFHPLEEYAGPAILTVSALCFFFLSVQMFSSEFVRLPLVERDFSTVFRILEYASI